MRVVTGSNPVLPIMKVAVSVYRKTKLRLVWRFNGQRYYLNQGDNDGIGQRVAERLARQIELDCLSGNFDPTLNKYRPEDAQPNQQTLDALFEQFTRQRAKRNHLRTMEKYGALRKQLNEFYGDRKRASAIKRWDAERFFNAMERQVKGRTLRDKIGLLNACWEWAIARNIVQENPWTELLGQIRVTDARRPRPFSEAEVEQILLWLQEHQPCYTDFVTFVFGTGVRIGEAIALSWDNLSDDCSICWIGQSFDRNQQLKETKTGRSRQFRLTPRLADMLRRRREIAAGEMVFHSPRGDRVHDKNFANRVWRPMLKDLGIQHREPYTMRSTFVSHALKQGTQPEAIAKLTGHSLRVLFTHYAGLVEGSADVPDLF